MSVRKTDGLSTSKCDTTDTSFVKDHAGCTPKKSQLTRLTTDGAKQRVMEIITRKRKSLGTAPVQHSAKENKVVNLPKINCELQAENFDLEAKSSKTFLKCKKSRMHAGLKSIITESVVSQPSSPKVEATEAGDSTPCMKTYDNDSTLFVRRSSRRVTISDHIEMFSVYQTPKVTTPWDKIKVQWCRSRDEPSRVIPLAVMRTDAGHTPLKPSHRKRRCSMYDERLI